jgi:2-polyprenyl-6-hydroxyphenyl methylase/3-demethylubiquinone-9 3-methyltransferase
MSRAGGVPHRPPSNRGFRENAPSLVEDVAMGKERARPGIDAAELAKFAPLAARWWDVDGPMRPLHKLNPTRLDYILRQACDHHGRVKGDRRPLTGLTVLDVGCGGGLLTEPLTRLGARVTGLDPEPASIEAATWHAAEVGLAIDYRAATLEDLLTAGETFDLVLAMEVVEHVPDQDGFVRELGGVVRPGGLLVMATLARTLRALALGIVAAEYLLGWLPRGTHDWRRFVTPAELGRMVRRAGLRVTDVSGVVYDAAHDRFTLTRDARVNYMLTAARDAA